MQFVSNTKVILPLPPWNHCLFSLSATKLTTLLLRQPISFYSESVDVEIAIVHWRFSDKVVDCFAGRLAF